MYTRTMLTQAPAGAVEDVCRVAGSAHVESDRMLIKTYIHNQHT